MSRRVPWAPLLLLCLGLLGVRTLASQREQPLRQPLHSAVPRELLGHLGTDTTVSDAARSAALATAHLARVYRPRSGSAEGEEFEIHVCYYSRQGPEKWEASPGLCHHDPLWAIVRGEEHAVRGRESAVPVRRYTLTRDRGRGAAVALVWHQGRGRVEANQYRVRWNRILDGALRRRGDEAVVRVMVTEQGRGRGEALRLAEEIAAELVPRLDAALQPIDS